MTPKPKPSTKHSMHRMADGSVEQIERKWHPTHIEAGYHTQEWGHPSTPDSELLGTYSTSFYREVAKAVNSEESEIVEEPITVTVSHLEVGHSGAPEFKLEWSDGMAVTVLDDATVLEYLVAHGAAEVTPD